MAPAALTIGVLFGTKLTDGTFPHITGSGYAQASVAERPGSAPA
jgi:hypothetical protein